MKHILSKTLLSLSVLASASAFAAEGYVTGNVYLRAGPDSGYPTVEMLAAGTPVAIEGCVNGWSWCDVDAGGNRGWVEGGSLQDDYRGQRVLVPQYGVEIGIPIISFAFATYWQDHYRNESWYPQRQRWSRVRPRYQTVVVQHDVHEDSRASAHGNSRDTQRAYSTSHTAAPRTRGESNSAAAVAAPAHNANRPISTAHNAASPGSRVPVSHAVTQHPAVQPRATVAQHRETARPQVQRKKQPAKSKSDQNKHPDSSGQY